ncbi:basic helix-loop-helix protein 80-like [Actinidia eriantha]|uniref:basic helix-loop-helix protein 80-like n=1 Tax=Actinidia eriantha TaxID=165200 RepID=UPI002588AD7F|nr:basic helix-loop-helix protein 80-like [Actinidia eriantha]
MHLHTRQNGSLENRNGMKVPVSYIKKQGIDSSSMVGELKIMDQVETQLEKKRKTMGCKVDRVQGKYKKEKKYDDRMSRNRGEKKVKAERKDQKTANEEAPTGYVHVRARRGQATDSHSLAKRLASVYPMFNDLDTNMPESEVLP